MKLNTFLSWVLGASGRARGIGTIVWIFGIFCRLTMLLLPVISLAMIYEVVKRYVFADPTVWVNEFSVWMAAVVYLVSGLYVTMQRAHIRITTFIDMVPRKFRLMFEALSIVILAIYVAAIVFGGWESAVDALLSWERVGTAFNPPIPATIKPLVLIVSVLVLIQSCINFLQDLKK